MVDAPTGLGADASDVAVSVRCDRCGRQYPYWGDASDGQRFCEPCRSDMFHDDRGGTPNPDREDVDMERDL